MYMSKYPLVFQCTVLSSRSKKGPTPFIHGDSNYKNQGVKLKNYIFKKLYFFENFYVTTLLDATSNDMITKTIFVVTK